MFFRFLLSVYTLQAIEIARMHVTTHMKWLKNKSAMLITMTANINHGVNLTNPVRTHQNIATNPIIAGINIIPPNLFYVRPKGH